MFYIIYKTTNLINNKFYIGKHKTSNLQDGYLGSGNLILAAIKKYGIKNFKKEILFQFSSEKEMNQKEKEIVTEELLKRDDVYNLCPGGMGGFGYINKNYWTKEKKLEHNNKITPFKNLNGNLRRKYSSLGGIAIREKTILRNKSQRNRIAHKDTSILNTIESIEKRRRKQIGKTILYDKIEKRTIKINVEERTNYCRKRYIATNTNEYKEIIKMGLS